MEGKKRGRPNEGLSNIVRFKVTDDVLSNVNVAAQGRGMTISEWLRMATETQLNKDMKPWRNYSERRDTV